MVNVQRIPGYFVFLIISETMGNHMIIDTVASEMKVATEEVEVSHTCTICGKNCPKFSRHIERHNAKTNVVQRMQ